MSIFGVRPKPYRSALIRLKAIEFMGLCFGRNRPGRQAMGCVAYDRRCAEIQKRREAEA